MDSVNLPVPVDGPLVHYSTPEEWAAALMAQKELNSLIEQHNEERRYDERYPREETRDNDQFLYGQNFETEPEVWDAETWNDATQVSQADLDPFV